MRKFLLSATTATFILSATPALSQDNSVKQEAVKPPVSDVVAVEGKQKKAVIVNKKPPAEISHPVQKANTSKKVVSDAEIERVIEEAARVRNYQGAKAKGASAKAQTVPANSTQSAAHIVKKGDTLYNLSKRYHVKIADIRSANDLEKNAIEIGQSLTIPAKRKTLSSNASEPQTVLAENQASSSSAAVKRVILPVKADTNATYAVLPKDTLYSISKRSCVKVEALASANGLSNPNALKPGQTLIMPEDHCLKR